MYLLSSVLLGMFILSTAVDGAHFKESVTVTVQATDVSPTKTQMNNMLARANLEGHGYHREETIKLTDDKTSGKQEYMKIVFYFKIVNCSQAQQIIQELKDLLPTVMGPTFTARIRKDMEAQNSSGGQCKIGIKFFSKPTAMFKRSVPLAKSKRGKIHIKFKFFGVEVDIKIEWGSKAPHQTKTSAPFTPKLEHV